MNLRIWVRFWVNLILAATGPWPDAGWFLMGRGRGEHLFLCQDTQVRREVGREWPSLVCLCLKGLLLLFAFGLVTWGLVGTSCSIFHGETSHYAFYFAESLPLCCPVCSTMTGVLMGVERCGAIRLRMEITFSSAFLGDQLHFSSGILTCFLNFSFSST